MTRKHILYCLVVIAGVGLRVWLWFGMDTNSDECFRGLMSIHILQGKEFPIFLLGQHYGGTLPQFATAFFFGFLGVSLPVLRLFPFLITLLSMFLFYRLIRSFLREPALGFAFLAYAVPSMMFVPWTIRISMTSLSHCLMLSLFLIAVSYAGKPAWWKLLAAGFVSGVALWTYFLTIPAVLVTFALLILVARGRERIRVSALFGCSLVVGLFPLLVDFARWGGIPPMPFASSMPGAGGVGAVMARLRTFTVQVFPDMPSFPLRQEPMKMDLVALIQLLLLLGALVVGVVRSVALIRKWWKEGRLLTPSVVAFFALAAHFALYLGVYVSSGYGRSITHRFLVYLFPLLFVFYGWFLAWLVERLSPLAAVLPVAFLLLSHNAAAFDMMYDMRQAEDFHIPSQTIAKLAAYLRQEGYDRVYTDYWVSYRLVFATNEEIIASSRAGPIVRERYHSYAEAVAEAEQPAYVLYWGPPFPWSEAFQQEMKRLGISYRRIRIDMLDVYTDFSRRFAIEEIRFPRVVGNRVEITSDQSNQTGT